MREVHPLAQVLNPKNNWSPEPSYRLSMWQGILHACGAVPVAMVLNQYEPALQRRL